MEVKLKILTISHYYRRLFSSLPQSNNIIQTIVTNRNPRNLERLRLARKPVGYYLDNKNVEYWHKLVLESSNRFVVASLIHNNGQIAVTASTKDWPLRKFLYSGNDTSAYINLARYFAEKCLETGLSCCFNEIKPIEGSKVEMFLKTLEEEGLSLKEPDVFNIRNIWHKVPEKKPWLVQED